MKRQSMVELRDLVYRALCFLLLFHVGFLLWSTTACAEFTFIPLGDLPDKSESEIDSRARGISADGSIVFGYSDDAPILWKLDGSEIVVLHDQPGYEASTRPESISGNGSTIVGYEYNTGSGNSHIYAWNASQGEIEFLDDQGRPIFGIANGISENGAVIVGYTPNEAFRWTEETGLVKLGKAGGNQSRARDVSDDGATIVGYADTAFGSNNEAFVWTEDHGITLLGDLEGGGEFSWAEAVSSDGSYVAGTGTSDLGREAFRWDYSTGFTSLESIDGITYASSEAEDISGNGNTIVGVRTSVSGLTEAFLWRDDLGSQGVESLLVSSGIDMTGWRLTHARGISADGLTIVGEGFHNGHPGAWMVKIGEAVPEPSTCTLVLTTLCVVMGRRWRGQPSFGSSKQ